MEKRLKDLLRTLVPELRHVLLGRYDAAGQPVRGDLDRELERLGVAPDGTITPLDALSNPTPADRRARRVAEAQLAGQPAKERPAARREIVERAGYSWINRLLALRAMEARGLIDDTLRANPAYDGLPEALFILRQTQPERAAGADGGWWAVVEDACRAQAAALPGLLDLDDPNTALRPTTPALLSCVALIGGGPNGYTAEESDAAFRDPDAIGWAYQFYQDEAKARTYAKLGAGGKVETRAEIAAVTQLFTEPYMVKWLLQNSLGRTYHELYPDSRLPETWEYYIQPAEGSDEPAADRPFATLEDLTCMDPCMGGGHFMREEFDMLTAMYREQHPDMGARDMADRILGQHLHGIDIDPRAAQLAALTLYLRAWELVRDERRAQRLPGPGSYMPAALNLATTPIGLTPGVLERHLARHPEDRVYEPLLRGVFAALEQAPILGSLLRPAEHLDEAILAFRRRSKGQYGLLPEDQALNRLLEELGRHDAAELKRVLLERVARSFAADARADDVAASLFGREATEGLRLMELLGGRYAVVATNPPYMGRGNLNSALKNYLEVQYPAGKNDLYAAFILRCGELARSGGRSGLLTLHVFLTAKAFVGLRRQILEAQSIENFVHLGTGTMKSLSNPNAQGFCMYVLRSTAGESVRDQVGLFIRLVDSPDKETALRAVLSSGELAHQRIFVRRMGVFRNLPDHQYIYWVSETLLARFARPDALGCLAATPKGLTTADNDRFLRFGWEVSDSGIWRPYAKGGGYRKWSGLQHYCVRWDNNGGAIKAYPSAVVRNEPYYDLEGMTYTEVANGAFGVRTLARAEMFDARSPGFFTAPDLFWPLLVVLNSRTASYLFRALSPYVLLDQAYAPKLPIPSKLTDESTTWAKKCWRGKVAIAARDVTEREFEWRTLASLDLHRRLAEEAFVLTAEGLLEQISFRQYEVSAKDQEEILRETGTPAGRYPLVVGYDQAPSNFGDFDATAQDRISVTTEDLARIRGRLRALYEVGSGAKLDDDGPEIAEQHHDDDGASSGACIPIPSEFFLEELSRKLELHPISVYWLLEELRAEGARCKPEERRILEDRLSVLVLRLLGHRWPKQIEAGDPVPDWADADGIIPLTPGTGDPTLAERVRARLRAEDGPLGLQQTEALLQELTGQDLDTWLRKSFFSRHVRQFKHRPVAWHLASTPQAAAGGRRKKANRSPAFECLVYYHACGGDVLARIRTHYVGTLLDAERRQADHARRTGDETAAAQAADRICELEEFAERLRRVEKEGFSCADLEERVEQEPLDRWSGDGVFPPASRAELLTNERAWRVDINDGVRVNIAPLQQAGLLASGVLNAKDVPKAIADRARWRSDERRWVREGVLPRCGWMDESVPESPAWTARAPEREAERLRLEEKRAAAVARLEGGSG